MLDKTIDSALLALRKQIIRGDGKGQEQVEALLAMRGVPMPRVMPPKAKDVVRKGGMTRIVTQLLRDGPKALLDLVAGVKAARPTADPTLAYGRTAQALTKLKAKGVVAHEGRLWRLAPVRPSHGNDITLLEKA